MKTIMILSEENEEFLQHYGVKGMRWGVRRNRTSGGSGGSGGSATKKSQKAEVKALTQKIKAAKKAAWEKEIKEFGKKERAMLSKIDAEETVALSQVNAKAKNRLQRMLGTASVRSRFEQRRMNVVGELEDKYISKEKQRKKEKREAEFALDSKLADRWAKRYDAEVKGKGLKDGLKAFLEMDRDESHKQLMEWLDLELQFVG